MYISVSHVLVVPMYTAVQGGCAYCGVYREGIAGCTSLPTTLRGIAPRHLSLILTFSQELQERQALRALGEGRLNDMVLLRLF